MTSIVLHWQQRGAMEGARTTGVLTSISVEHMRCEWLFVTE